METLLLALSPLFITFVIAAVKRLRASKVLTKGGRMVVLRVIVALLSYGAIVGKAMIGDEPVDLVATETFVDTLVMIFASTGLYFFGKKKIPVPPPSPEPATEE